MHWPLSGFASSVEDCRSGLKTKGDPLTERCLLFPEVGLENRYLTGSFPTPPPRRVLKDLFLLRTPSITGHLNHGPWDLPSPTSVGSLYTSPWPDSVTNLLLTPLSFLFRSRPSTVSYLPSRYRTPFIDSERRTLRLLYDRNGWRGQSI